MTSLEQECLDVLTVVLDELAAGHSLKYRNRMEFLGKIRDAKKHLENKKYGCMTGLHAGPCSCQEGTPGNSRGRC